MQTMNEVWVMNADGTSPRRLAQGGYPSWGSDSRRVFYHSRLDGYLYSVSLEDSTDQKRLHRCRSQFPVVSPDGNYMADLYGSSLDLRTLEVVELSTGSTVARWDVPALLGGFMVNWSPDGRRLCVGGYGLWEFNLKTFEAKKLLRGFVQKGQWSRDGQYLAFEIIPREIWIARAQDIGEGQTLEDHYQGVIRWASRRIEAGFLAENNRFSRAAAYLELKKTDKAMADLEWLDQHGKRQASWAGRYNVLAWRLVAGPEEMRNPEVALRLAQKAAKLRPSNSFFHNTLGVAHYRSGQYKQALAVLQKTDKVNRLKQSGGIPWDVAFIAMAQYQLGHHEEAKKSLKRLRGLLKEGSFAGDPEGQGFLREAEALIGR